MKISSSLRNSPPFIPQAITLTNSNIVWFHSTIMTPNSLIKNTTKTSTSPKITLFKRFTSFLSQAIDYIQNYIDIADTPLEDIINYLERLQVGDNLDKMLLRKKILKRKNFLKRYRAKNRPPKFVCAYEQFSMLVPVPSGEN
jgi:hypothetical protein